MLPLPCALYIYGIIDKQMWLLAKWLNQQHSASQARGREGGSSRESRETQVVNESRVALRWTLVIQERNVSLLFATWMTSDDFC